MGRKRKWFAVLLAAAMLMGILGPQNMRTAWAAGTTGLVQESDGSWSYYVNGAVDTTFTGLVQNAGETWYVEKGKLNFGFTDLFCAADGWYFVMDGRVPTEYTGLVRNSEGLWYVENGKINWEHTGLVNSAEGWHYVLNGRVTEEYTGLVRNEEGMWYVAAGILDWNHTALVSSEEGWFYVMDGRVTEEYTGLVRNEAGMWYIDGGKLNWEHCGLVSSEEGWFYVQDGRVPEEYVGLVANENGNWYVQNGTISFNYEGLVGDATGWWYVQGSQVNTNYTGLATNENGTWYVQNGGIDFGYTGTVTINGKEYTVSGGAVLDASGSDETPDETPKETMETITYGNMVFELYFDADGVMTEQKRYDAEGTLLDTNTVIHSTKNGEIEVVFVSTTGGIAYHTYTAEGVLSLLERRTTEQPWYYVEVLGENADGTLNYTIHSDKCYLADRIKVMKRSFDTVTGAKLVDTTYYYNLDDELVGYVLVRYNDAGKKREEIEYTADGIEICKYIYFLYHENGVPAIKYEYDANDVLVKIHYYDSEGLYTGFTYLEHDENGWIIYKEQYSCSIDDIEGELQNYTYYDHYASGALRTLVTYAADGTLIEEVNYKEDGTIIDPNMISVTSPEGIRFELYFDEETGKMDLQKYYDAAGNYIDSNMVFYDIVYEELNSITYSGQRGGNAYYTYYDDGTLKESVRNTKGQDWYYAVIVSGDSKDNIVCEFYHVTDLNKDIKEKYTADGSKASYEEDTFIYIDDINYIISSEYKAYNADGTINYLDSELKKWERDEKGDLLSDTVTEYYADGSVYSVEEHTYLEGTGIFDEENLTIYYADGTINYEESYKGKNTYREDGSLKQLAMYSLDANLLVALHEYDENNVYTRASWYFYTNGVMHGYAVSDIDPDTWEKINEMHYDAAGNLLYTIVFDENGNATIIYPEVDDDIEVPELGSFPEITYKENTIMQAKVFTSEEEINDYVFEMLSNETYYPKFGVMAEDLSMLHTAEEYMWLYPEIYLEIDGLTKYYNGYYLTFKNGKPAYGIDVEHMYAIRTGDTSKLDEKELAAHQELLRINEELGLDDMETDIEKILAAHDYLVLNVAYDEEHVANDEAGIINESEDCHYVEGTLLNNLAVCSGYASTFRLLMELQGIHCDYITNAGHGWNAVELDGEWYFIDVTWDDPVPDEPGRLLHTYFMVPEEVIINAGGHDGWSCECGVAHVCDSTEYMLYPVQEYVFTTEEEAKTVIQNQADLSMVTLIYPADGTFTQDVLLNLVIQELSLYGGISYYPETSYRPGYNWMRVITNPASGYSLKNSAVAEETLVWYAMEE